MIDFDGPLRRTQLLRVAFPRRLGVACVLGALAALAGASTVVAQTVPAFSPAPCPFDIEAPGSQGVECGTVAVPRNRDRPDGRTFDLSVVVLRSTADRPRADPVIFLSGGPGSAVTTNGGAYVASGFVAQIREQRDFIIWDQRGTGASEPTLCPDLAGALIRTQYGAAPSVDRNRAAAALVHTCRQRMVAAQIDVAAINSAISAHDLVDIRRALGYEEWNLIGVSYGTTLALTAIREAPEGIRAVSGLFRTQWEHLEAVHRERHERTGPRWIGGQGADEGRQERFIPVPDLAYQQLVRAESGRAHRAPGRHPTQRSVRRSPAGRREIAPDRSTVAARHPRLAKIGDEQLESVCAFWHDARADATLLRSPIASDIPALVTSGEFDPITPPAFALAVMQHLTAGKHFEIGGVGHGAVPNNSCGRSLMLAFLDDPRAALDATCVDERPAIKFETDIVVSTGMARFAERVRGGPGAGLLIWSGGTLLVLFSAVLIWPAAWLGGRRRGRSTPPKGSMPVRVIVGVAASTALAFAVGLMWVVRGVANPSTLVFGVPGRAAPLLWLPWVVLGFTVVSVGTVVFGRTETQSGRVARYHLLVVVAATVSFTILLGRIGFLSSPW